MKDNGHAIVRIAEKIDSAAYFISKLCMILCGFLLVGVTLMICAGVLNRTFTNWSWLFVEEWSGLALVPMSYLAFGYTLRWNKHLKMDLITRRMSIKWQNLMAVFSAIFSLACLWFLIQFSYEWLMYTVERNVVSSGPMQTPLWFFSLSVLAGIALFALDMILFLLNRIFALVLKQAPLHFYDPIGESQTPAASECEKGGAPCN